LPFFSQLNQGKFWTLPDPKLHLLPWAVNIGFRRVSARSNPFGKVLFAKGIHESSGKWAAQALITVP